MSGALTQRLPGSKVFECASLRGPGNSPGRGRRIFLSSVRDVCTISFVMQDSALSGLEILIVEDETLLRKQLTAYLQTVGMEVTGAETKAGAARLAGEMNFDFVLLDVSLPDGSGLELLREGVFAPDTGVIVMTAHGGVSGAVEAMRLGALEYLVKPFDAAELPLVIARARRARQSERIEEHRRKGADEQAFFFGAALAPLKEQLEKILAADRRLQGPLPPVLIHGETGTGKTAIARWLHHHGPRASQPLVEVNCAVLPESLAESELFGHERGAFTDARTARMGLFQAAQGGTLLLDELPSLSLALQAKVLTAIEDRKIRRLGGTREIPVDARVIAATNRNLRQLAEVGQFREDLFHRLDLLRLQIPPLRERGEDIVRLGETILERLCQRHRLARATISPAGRQRLLAHHWPGNVRELAHELERALVFEGGGQLHFEHLRAPVALAGGAAPQQAQACADWFNDAFAFPGQGFKLEEAIQRLIAHALKQAGNNVSAAARLLGVSRDYIRYRQAGGKKDTP